MNSASRPSRSGGTAPALTEKQFQQRVLDYAALRGWKAYHTHDSRRSQPGFPDLVLARRGRVLFAELKADKGRLSKEQIAWLDELPYALVWRPADWPEVMRVLL